VVKTKKEMAKLDKEKQKEEEESLEDLGVALADKEVDMSPLLKVT
jgi:hypothetical protein